MAYDTELADRIRELLAAERGVEEKRMFGGLAFLINGNMSVAASSKGGLMVRVPPDETERLLTRDHVEPMVMAGRETRGWLRVRPEGLGPSASCSRGWSAAWTTRRAFPPDDAPPAIADTRVPSRGGAAERGVLGSDGHHHRRHRGAGSPGCPDADDHQAEQRAPRQRVPLRRRRRTDRPATTS